ncbi:Guanylate kinase-associated protein mars [Frankliniella fusca]|uniref:Guanylate kinase-associated protein mars n=1 Tax=Frankliniella fusca TaxID=407009 RepID=A0AAE1GRH0_9NEOP|nr:Guanylate kinase-associated protein mars [Frankliniella fusca]
MDNYRALYKAGKAQKLPDQKRQVAIREQKRRREDTFLGRRNFQKDDRPAPSSPAPRLQETRREKLLRWKAEKDKLLAQQKLAEKKRPPFKVGVAHHAIDPNKELTETIAKCATQKKIAKELRTTVTKSRKAPTDAASSLAALAAPAPERSTAFSGRVTRSRTAAAAVAAAVPNLLNAKAKIVKPSTQANLKKTQSISTRSVKAAAAPAAIVSISRTAIVSKKSPKTSKSGNKDHETSFAPQNHKFKAPASLTLPTTPLMLKRKAARVQEANWPHISGVSILHSSPDGPSPKVAKIVASDRRGRLSRAVKEKTPKALPQVSKLKDKTPKKSPKVSKSALKEKTPKTSLQVSNQKEKTHKKSPKVLTPAVREKTPKKSPNVPQFIEKVKTPRKLQVSESLIAETSESPNMSRSQRRSGAFVVTDLPVKTTSTTEVVKETFHVSDKAEETIKKKSKLSQGSARKSTGSKRRESTREKENMPADDSEIGTEEALSLSMPAIDEMDSVILSSRRMSIHEPSPEVHVSPENLSSGMVPAQFSPFITSARGKDKYSTQKRRSSLIPMVQELSPVELVKCRQIEHFRNLLERESSRLLTLSSVWEERQAEAPPVVEDKILGPVGQARLLVKDKFQQFRRLVDKFEAGDPEGNITADDLTGFWEMMLLTVENVDKRFQELEDLKENNWEEKEPEKPVKKTLPVAVCKTSKPRTQAQSRLKELIENARRKRQEAKQNKSANTSAVSTLSDSVATFDGGFFRVESPKKVLPTSEASTASRTSQVKHTTPYQLSRRSLLQQVLTHSAVRALQSPAASPLNKSLPLSPSPKVAVAQLRASQIGKRMSMESSNDVFNQSPASPVLKTEPTKSILKSAARRSLRINTPRNRVAFDVLNHSANSSLGSPTLHSPVGTPQSKTPLNKRMSTPGSRKRTSLIPRPITPKDRPSLMPVRESIIPTKPLPNGDLIDFDSPARLSFA